MAHYPQDEFDRLPPTGRRGAHRRDEGAGQRSAYVIIAVVAMIAVLLVLVVVNIIRTSFMDPESQVAPPPTAEGSNSPGEEQDEPGDSVAMVDKSSVVVAVFNSSGVSGAAATFAEAAEGSGWVVDEIGNHPSPDNTSAVYYSSPEHEVHAAALAEELGIDRVEESGEFSADLSVMVASDIAEGGPPDTAETDTGTEPALEEGG